MSEVFRRYRDSGYMVGTRGTIISPFGRILKPFEVNSGYLCVFLFLEKKCAKTVHSIVAEVWLGKRPAGKIVNHKDTNKHNNRKKNLEYITPQENNLHAVEAGTLPSGERHYKASIPEKKARRIWKCIQAGMRNAIISEKLSVPQTIVRDIRSGKSWKSITGIVRLNDKGRTDSAHHLNQTKGESKFSVKEQVRIIQKIVSNSGTDKELAESLNLSRTMISSIKHKRTWMKAWKKYESIV